MLNVGSTTFYMSCYYYKVGSLNISAFTYAFFLLDFYCTNVLGSYCRLARVRFAWLRNSREDLFQSTSVTLRRHGRSTKSIAASIRYIHGLSGMGKLHGNTTLLYPETYFWYLDMIILRPPRKSFLHLVPQTFHVTVQCFNTVLCEIYCGLI